MLKRLQPAFATGKRAVLVFGIFAGVFALLTYFSSSAMAGTLETYAIININGLTALLVSLNLGMALAKMASAAAVGGASVFGAGIGTLAAGCPVCGTGVLASVLSSFGVAGGLSLLPFHGWELRVLGIAILGTALFFAARPITCASRG